MATTGPLARVSPCLRSVAYLVRSFQTNARIRSLTTGTFNRVVKDRIAVRRSGANSVQANSLQERIRLSSKPFNHTCCLKPCQREPFTEFPRDFHNGKDLQGRTGEQKTRSSARWYGLPLRSADFGAGRSGRQKIEKRTYFWRSLP